MVIPWENLNNLPVETRSGEGVGRVIGCDVETETSYVKNYRVKNRGIIKGLLANELVVSRDQVISISKEKMVIEDGAITEPAVEARKVAIAPRAGAEISSRAQSSKN